jgi:hypothetical protein
MMAVEKTMRMTIEIVVMAVADLEWMGCHFFPRLELAVPVLVNSSFTSFQGYVDLGRYHHKIFICAKSLNIDAIIGDLQ